MTEREKIIEAMKVLKEVCTEGGCSDECPFYFEKECYITYYAPAAWEINEPEEIWRAYKR